MCVCAETVFPSAFYFTDLDDRECIFLAHDRQANQNAPFPVCFAETVLPIARLLVLSVNTHVRRVNV